MNNSNKWQASVSDTESLNKSSANVKSIKMIAAQRQHVKKLQENLEADESNFFRKFMSINGWEYFITKHTSTYQRPKDALYNIKNYFRKLEMEFDTEVGLPKEVMFTITYANGSGHKSYTHMKMRTNMIPISELEDFMKTVNN